MMFYAAEGRKNDVTKAKILQSYNVFFVSLSLRVE